jgi:hypothetical protein
MKCYVKNCYYIWIIALGGFPLEEASAYSSLFQLSKRYFLGFIFVFYRFLGFFTTFYVIALKFWG